MSSTFCFLCAYVLIPSAQAGRPDTVVFAIVRNAKGSTHLAAAVANLKNVHVVEADIVDHASLEVQHISSPTLIDVPTEALLPM